MDRSSLGQHAYKSNFHPLFSSQMGSTRIHVYDYGTRRPLRALALKSRYWKPGIDIADMISELVLDLIRDLDVIVVSEKAIAVALGRLCDESKIIPTCSARFLAGFWMRRVWGYFLGPLSRMSRINIERLRNYPMCEGASHKQAAIVYAGVTQALRHGSEGGMDVSNLPYSYVCIPIVGAVKVAKHIKDTIVKRSGKDVEVMIVDSDKTYSFRNLHITPRPNSVPGIHCVGVFAFIIGRLLKLRPRSTPIAFTSSEHRPDEALQIAAVSNRARGDGAGKTIWDIAERFGVKVTDVSWEMLESIPHFPVVIIRRR